MTAPHPVIALYYQEERPSEKAILAALKEHPTPVGVELSTIAHLATWARHTQVIFSGLLPSVSAGHARGHLIANILSYAAAHWLSSASGWWESLTQDYPTWSQELLLPDENGISGWDRYLVGRFNGSCAYGINADHNALMAQIAAVLEAQHSDAFHMPHPAFPEVSCAQVWAWLWACIPLRLTRLSHWGYLLSCAIDPNFAMEVKGGQMSMGTALLWAMHPHVKLPHPSKWSLPPDFVPGIPDTAKWLQHTHPKETFNEEFPWQALWMLRQAGMDPTQLKEPTPWGTPALGLLARRNHGGGQWTSEYFEKIQSRWLGLGLDMGAHSTHGRTLLDIAISFAPKHENPPAPLHPLDHWKISHATWQRALTPAAMERFWLSPLSLRVLDDEPKLKHALLKRICAEFNAWNAPSGEQENSDIQALVERLWIFESHQPLTPLGDVVMQHIQTRPLEKLFQAVMHFVLFRIKPDVALESIEEIEDRARAVRLASAFRGGTATPKMRQDLAKSVFNWALKEPENKSCNEQLHESALGEEYIDLLITVAMELRDDCKESRNPLSQLAKALLDYAPETLAHAQQKALLSSQSISSVPVCVLAYWNSTECTDVFEKSPRLIHELVCALIEDFTSWPFESEHSNWNKLAQRLECFDTLPELEFAITGHIRAVRVKHRVGLALRLAALKSTKPEDIASIEVLALHYRTRPLDDLLCKRITLTLETWIKKIVPPIPPPNPLLNDQKAIKAEKERAPEDDRAIVLLYTEKALEEVGVWSASRSGENAAVKSWRSRLVAEKLEQPAQLNNMLFQRHRTRRLALAKPAVDAMEEMRNGFPHFEDVIAQIQDHLSLAMCGDKSFSLPPLLMAGPPGTGKTFFFQELANKVATTYKLLNMESITAGFTIVGLDYGWGTSSPGIVFDTMLADGATANPILLLDEIDKVATVSSAPVAPVLLGLLEPHSARRFADRCFPLTMDVSRINWVATANYLDRVDLPLRSRFNIVHVASPDYNARCAMSRHIYKALRAVHSWGAFFDEVMPDETIQVLARPANAARDLRKGITAAFATAARANRRTILPSDIASSNHPRPLSPWDAPLPELIIPQRSTQEGQV